MITRCRFVLHWCCGYALKSGHQSRKGDEESGSALHDFERRRVYMIGGARGRKICSGIDTLAQLESGGQCFPSYRQSSHPVLYLHAVNASYARHPYQTGNWWTRQLKSNLNTNWSIETNAKLYSIESTLVSLTGRIGVTGKRDVHCLLASWLA